MSEMNKQVGSLQYQCKMADRYYSRNRWRTGHFWALRAAKSGERWAQYMVALDYDEGKGVRRNYPRAAYWYKRAAAQGYASAMLNLGILYGNGRGVRQNFRIAVRYYRLAAKDGNRNACYNLGLYYTEGRGVRKNDRWAQYWYSKAVDNRDREAARRLHKIKRTLFIKAIDDVSRQPHKGENQTTGRTRQCENP